MEQAIGTGIGASSWRGTMSSSSVGLVDCLVVSPRKDTSPVPSLRSEAEAIQKKGATKEDERLDCFVVSHRKDGKVGSSWRGTKPSSSVGLVDCFVVPPRKDGKAGSTRRGTKPSSSECLLDCFVVPPRKDGNIKIGMPSIGCNTESNTGRGFEFAGAQLGTSWYGNDMSNNGKGFYLNNAMIGTQGTSSVAAGNRWLGSTWSATNVNTYVLTNPASNSVLYVVPNSTVAGAQPLNNDGNPSLTKYSSTTLPISSIFPSTCYQFSPPVSGGRKILPLALRQALEKVAQDSFNYGGNEYTNRWMTQMQAYKICIDDTTLTDSSVILQSFVNTATGTRFEWLLSLEDAFAHNDDSTAAALLAAPVAAAGVISGTNGVQIIDTNLADNVANNYVQFYQLLHNLRTNNFTTTDSLALNTLSAKCPIIDGAIVYQARALGRFITNDLFVYNDDCGGSGNNARLSKENSDQAYQLIPNPNKGKFDLIQLVKNSDHVFVKVYDIVGRVLYDSKVNFIGNRTNIDLKGIVPGFYYVTISEKNRVSSIKFVVK